MTDARRLLQHMHPADNVATALTSLARGTVVPLASISAKDPSAGTDEALVEITVHSDVPFGHKVALRAIGLGEPVRKYGEAIGLASAYIAPGDHVHTHNVESQRGRGDLKA
jgi:hypothetical protein